MRKLLFLACLVLAILPGRAQRNRPPAATRIAPASDEGEIAIKRFKYPEGLTMSLFAAEPMLANPVCITFDEKGRLYVAETFRHTSQVLDIRNHMNWLEEELASTTIHDRLSLFHKYFPGTNIVRFSLETEQIRLIEDTDGDGKADKATVFADGFTNVLDGIGAGLLARKGNLYYTCIPDLWLLKDTKGTGKADVRIKLQEGYGLRVAFLGHDLHGLRMGPDGRLYFSIGDRAFNVTQNDRSISETESGSVLRCEPDGSHLEIVATGLRNPQELAFDQYGNLFTVDNNADGGDRARLVYVVEGGDSGWRIGFQHLNYPVKLGMWSGEKMWYPEWKETDSQQAAHLLPPVAWLASGPSGLTFYSGRSLPETLNNHFFLADFKGSSVGSIVHNFGVTPKGASFDMTNRTDFIKGMLATDVEIGYDGAVYLADWVESFDKQGKGRIYKVVDPQRIHDPSVLEVKSMVAQGIDTLGVAKLESLLGHFDPRVRLEAQFALAEKGESSKAIFQRVAKSNTNQLARIHAIWGLGQLQRKAMTSGKKGSDLDSILPLLADPDPEIRAQAAKAVGDGEVDRALSQLKRLVQDGAFPRVQFFAALSLGKLGNKDAVEPVLSMLRSAGDKDPYLRHAGVMALLGVHDAVSLERAAKDSSEAVRVAVLVAYRRMGNPEVVNFLNDSSSRLVFEAAAAINDAPIYAGLPKLAGMLQAPVTMNHEPFIRRALNANYRLGMPANAQALAEFAADKNASTMTRHEALLLLTRWEKPNNLDEITSLYRPIMARDPHPAAAALAPYIRALLEDGNERLQTQAVAAVTSLKMTEASPALYAVVTNHAARGTVRAACLRTLTSLGSPMLVDAILLGFADADKTLRIEAIRLQSNLKPDQAVPGLSKILDEGSIDEQQAALTALGKMDAEPAEKVLSTWTDRFVSGATGGSIKPALDLELVDAAARYPALKAKIDGYLQNGKDKDPLFPYKIASEGGNAADGRRVFMEKNEVSCVRCHKIGSDGAEVGPNLDAVGTRGSREYILESIILPNKQIAQGFETTIVSTKKDTTVTGILKSEDDNQIAVMTTDDGLVKIAKSDIESRKRGPSAMPEGLGDLMSRKELRDLVEYLSSLKK